MNAVFERYPNGGGEMLLALSLADHAHDDGTHVYPSIAQLAIKTRQSERAVQYQLARMRAMGWIILVSEGAGRGRPNEYRISAGWIKGEDLAPIPEPIKRVQSEAEKGANGDIKGCNPLHPLYNQQEPSIEPSGSGVAASTPKPASKKKKPQAKKGSKVNLAQWLETIKAKGEKPIPEGHSIFDYADRVGLPPSYLAIAWAEFKRRYIAKTDKRYIDWRAVFRNSVESNWFKLWHIDAREEYFLSTEGKQAKRLMESEAA